MKINLAEKALNLIFPPVCGICSNFSNGYLCITCYEYLKKQEKNRMDKYADKEFSEHFWIYEYKDEIRDKIIDYKFNDKSYLYRTFLELIIKNKRAIEYINSYDIVIPVPIHKKRYKKRGYNQSDLIAKALVKKLEGLKYINDILIKTKNVSPQSSLNKTDREKNILDAYSINEKYNSKITIFQGKRILLIDDVFTTGSTLNECAKVLKQAGNFYIGTFSIAKVE